MISYAAVISSITFLSVVFGELVPKRLALNYPETIAKLIGPLIYIVSQLFRPIIWILESSTRVVLWAIPLSVRPRGFISQEELNEALTEGARSGLIEAEEKNIVHKVFRLGDRPIWTIMTSRTDLVTVNVDDPIDTSLRRAKESDHLLYPALDDDGKVLGVVSGQDLYAVKFEGKNLQSVIRPALIAPCSLTTLTLLRRLRESGQDIAIAVDEYGTAEGIITTHDLLESLVGEIGEDAPSMVRREDGSYLIDAAIDITDVFSELGIIEEVDLRRYHSLSGFMLCELHAMPEIGRSITKYGWTFEVAGMGGRQIAKVLATKSKESENQEHKDDEDS